MTLLCKKCGKDRPESDFSKHSQCVGGYDTSRCKPCKKAAYDWTSTPIEKRLYNRVKSRAKRKGLPFDLKLEDVVLPDECPIFGTKFVYGDTDLTYSVDRIVPEKGYVKGNIQIISNRANRAKNDLTLEEMKALVKYMSACEIAM